MEVATRPLSEEEWVVVAHRLFGLVSKAETSLTYFLGVGADLPVDELWQVKEVSARQLPAVFDRSICEHIVEPGFTDFFVEWGQQHSQIRVCRSLEIHVKNEDRAFLEAVHTLYRELRVTDDSAGEPPA